MQIFLVIERKYNGCFQQTFAHILKDERSILFFNFQYNDNIYFQARHKTNMWNESIFKEYTICTGTKCKSTYIVVCKNI